MNRNNLGPRLQDQTIPALPQARDEALLQTGVDILPNYEAPKEVREEAGIKAYIRRQTKSANIKDLLEKKYASSEDNLNKLLELDKQSVDELQNWGRIPDRDIDESPHPNIKFWDRTALKNFGDSGGSEEAIGAIKKMKDLYPDLDMAVQDGRMFFSDKNSTTWHPLDPNIPMKMENIGKLAAEFPKEVSDNVRDVAVGVASAYGAGAVVARTAWMLARPMLSNSVAVATMTAAEEASRQVIASKLGLRGKDISWSDIVTVGGLSGLLSMPFSPVVAEQAVNDTILKKVNTRIKDFIQEAYDFDPSKLSRKFFQSRETKEVNKLMVDRGVYESAKKAPFRDEAALATRLSIKRALTPQEKVIMSKYPLADSPKDAIDMYRKDLYTALRERTDAGMRGLVERVYDGLTREAPTKISAVLTGKNPDSIKRMVTKMPILNSINTNRDGYLLNIAQDSLNFINGMRLSVGEKINKMFKAADKKNIKIDIGDVISNLDENINNRMSIADAPYIDSRANQDNLDMIKTYSEMKDQFFTLKESTGKQKKVEVPTPPDPNAIPIERFREPPPPLPKMEAVDYPKQVSANETFDILQRIKKYCKFDVIQQDLAKLPQIEQDKIAIARSIYTTLSERMDKKVGVRNLRENYSQILEHHNALGQFLAKGDNVTANAAKVTRSLQEPYKQEGTGVYKILHDIDSRRGVVGTDDALMEKLKNVEAAREYEGAAKITTGDSGPSAIAGGVSGTAKTMANVAGATLPPGSGPVIYAGTKISSKLLLSPRWLSGLISMGYTIEQIVGQILRGSGAKSVATSSLPAVGSQVLNQNTVSPWATTPTREGMQQYPPAPTPNEQYLQGLEK